jgi:uncharacterized protein (TIGR03000 family)
MRSCRFFQTKVLAAAVVLLLLFASTGNAQRVIVFRGGGGWGYPYFGGWGSPLYGGWGSPLYGGYYGGWGSPNYGGWGNPYYGGWGNTYSTYTPNYGGYNSYSPSASSYFRASSTPNPFVIPSWAYEEPSSGSKEAGEARATIEVKVPASAKVTFDGKETSMKGTDRTFATPLLTLGRSYVYEVQASWTDKDGATITQKREVTVQPGKRSTVSFASNQ